MSEKKSITLLKAAKELNIGIGTAVDFLVKSGFEVEAKPAYKLDNETYNALLREFQGDKIVKEEANQIVIGKIRREETTPETASPRKQRDHDSEEILIKNAGALPPLPKEKPVESEPTPAKEPEVEEVRKPAVPGMKIVGKVDLDNLRGGRADKKAKPAPVAEEKPEEPAATPAPGDTTAPQAQQEQAAEPAADAQAPEAPAAKKPESAPESSPTPAKKEEPVVIRAKAERLTGPN